MQQEENKSASLSSSLISSSEQPLNESLPVSTTVRNIKFSRCKCLGGMFGPIHKHNKYFYCRYDPEELQKFIKIEQLMLLFQPLYSHPILKVERLLSFILYALSAYLGFYVLFAVIWVSFNAIDLEQYALKLQVQAVLYFLILITLGIANQVLFHFQNQLIQFYLDKINASKLNSLHLYISLINEPSYYFCVIYRNKETQHQMMDSNLKCLKYDAPQKQMTCQVFCFKVLTIKNPEFQAKKLNGKSNRKQQKIDIVYLFGCFNFS